MGNLTRSKGSNGTPSKAYTNSAPDQHSIYNAGKVCVNPVRLAGRATPKQWPQKCVCGRRAGLKKCNSRGESLMRAVIFFCRFKPCNSTATFGTTKRLLITVRISFFCVFYGAYDHTSKNMKTKNLQVAHRPLFHYRFGFTLAYSLNNALGKISG